MALKNAYVVLDTETSIRDGLVFDFGGTTVSRKGKVIVECCVSYTHRTRPAATSC